MPTEYHCSVVIGHFARRLSETTKRGGPYQAIGLLATLWLEADPFALGPVVYVSSVNLVGLVPNDGRMRQLILELRKVGAIGGGRERGGYKLVKPEIEELDEIAQAQIAHARARCIVREQAPPREQGPSRTTDARRRETLAALGVQLSDVGAVLAVAANKRANDLLFSGEKAKHVQYAVDWIAETGCTWASFKQVCEAAHNDTRPGKPPKLEWLFAKRNRDYLGDLIVSSAVCLTGAELAAPAHDDAAMHSAKCCMIREIGLRASPADIEALAAMTVEFSITDAEWKALGDELNATQAVPKVGLCVTEAGRAWVVTTLSTLRKN